MKGLIKKGTTHHYKTERVGAKGQSLLLLARLEEELNGEEFFDEDMRFSRVVIPDFNILTTDFDRTRLYEYDRRTIDAITNLPTNKFAVRSSSPYEDGREHSFAGIFSTIRDVGRQGIPSAVTAVDSSALNDRAKSYAKHQGIPIDESMAVIIQEMIDS